MDNASAGIMAKDLGLGKSGSYADQESYERLRRKVIHRKAEKRGVIKSPEAHHMKKPYKKFKEDSSVDHNDPDSASLFLGYEADISDASIVFPREETCENVDTLYSQIIDTSSSAIPRPKPPRGANKSRREVVRKIWEARTIAYFKGSPSKPIKYLTNKYVDYLGGKLNRLSCKYTSMSWQYMDRRYREAKVLPFDLSYLQMIGIFSTKRMSQLFELYYDFLNRPKDLPVQSMDEEMVLRRNVYQLFELLEEDFTITHGKKAYTTGRNKKPVKEEQGQLIVQFSLYGLIRYKCILSRQYQWKGLRNMYITQQLAFIQCT
eukprot:TRINITY_DN1005_c0_g1_i1.p2 TRINITY_DN1005_c0_g1~~TRINITY_DN1005_c0_g1_i1.p2  ORF type:complete len:319 (+),score=17.93 TRINITY_DN1005_c0_g1_i1:2812-3768(+)